MTLRWSPGYAAVDEYFDNVSLLLHGDGTNGSQTIIDSSSSPKTGTAIGNAQISTAQSKFGGSSIVFDKVDDRITYAADNAFAFGTGDFTIEFWAYSRDVQNSTQRGYMQISQATGGLSSNRTNGLVFSQGIGGLGVLAINVNNTWLNTNSSVLVVNTWQFITASRQSGTLRLFVDGIICASGTNSSNIAANNLVVGGYESTNFLYDGYIDDLRITKGVARYTANFTPPTAPFPDLSPTTRLTLL